MHAKGLKYKSHSKVYWISLIIFICINRRKYWSHENFRNKIFDRYTRFGMPWTLFLKMSVYLCLCVSLGIYDKNFVARVARELINRIK